MSSLILELQKDAYESVIPVSELLRKALVVSRKLQQQEFEKWILQELNGYTSVKDNDEIPEYRKVSGNIRAHNPFYGWIPVIIDDSGLVESLTVRKVNSPLPQLEELVQSSNGRLQMSYPPNIERRLRNMMDFDLPIVLMIDKTQVSSIIQSVRNIILDWALKLEEDGILGEGMSFSPEEKQKAVEQNYTVNHFHGNLIQSPIQQNSHNSVQNTNYEALDLSNVTEILNDIRENLDKVNELSKSQKSEITASVETIETQLSSPNPKKKIISECLKTIRNVLEGAAGSIIASGILYKLNLLGF